MIVRPGKIADLVKLLPEEWAWDHEKNIQDRYIQAIKKGDQQFFVIEKKDQLVGEIHIFWNSQDKDEADGANRAYLSTWRIRPDCRGQGWGRLIFWLAFNLIKGRGFKEIAIGAYLKDLSIQQLYRRYGFTTEIKRGIDERGDSYVLLINHLLDHDKRKQESN